MTYLALSSVFLAIACAAAVLAVLAIPRRERGSRFRHWWGPLTITGVALVVLTAVFDNVMIALGFMVYSGDHTSGLTVGLAPLEDFSYPLAGLILLPALWVLLAKRPSGEDHE